MYWRHFNLTAEPFSLTPDPSFLYLSPVHAEAYAALMMGLRERRGLTTMIGEVGTGKTTLVYSVLSGLGPEIHTAYVSNARLSFDGILRVALRDFGVPCDSTHSTELTDALNAFLLNCANKGTTAAMVIDEAQNLAPETFEDLRLLTNFETYTHKLLQIVLVGQPELDTKLRDPALRQVSERVAVRCVVNPLNRRESRAYLEHRLAAVNGSLDIFTRPALQLLIARSRGIPRSLNILAHNAMLFAYGEAADRVSRRFVAAAVREKEGRGLVRLWRRSQRTAAVTRSETKRERRSSLWTMSAAAVCGMVVGLAVAGGENLLGRLSTPPAKATARASAPVHTLAQRPIQETADESAHPVETATASEPTLNVVSTVAPLPEAAPTVVETPPAVPAEASAPQPAPAPEAHAVDLAPAVALPTAPVNADADVPTPAPSEPQPTPTTVSAPSAPASIAAPAVATAAAAPVAAIEVAAAVSLQENLRPTPRPAAAETGTRAVTAPRPRPTTAAVARASRPVAPAARDSGSQASASDNAPPDRTRVITVPPGSSLSGLLLTVYGQYSSEMVDKVKAVNPQVSDPDFIIAGDKLRFPDASRGQPVQPAGGQQQR